MLTIWRILSILLIVLATDAALLVVLSADAAYSKEHPRRGTDTNPVTIKILPALDGNTKTAR